MRYFLIYLSDVIDSHGGRKCQIGVTDLITTIVVEKERRHAWRLVRTRKQFNLIDSIDPIADVTARKTRNYTFAQLPANFHVRFSKGVCKFRLRLRDIERAKGLNNNEQNQSLRHELRCYCTRSRPLRLTDGKSVDDRCGLRASRRKITS